MSARRIPTTVVLVFLKVNITIQSPSMSSFYVFFLYALPYRSTNGIYLSSSNKYLNNFKRYRKVCKILGPHIGSYECYNLRYSSMRSVNGSTFRRNILPPLSGSKFSRSRNQGVAGLQASPPVLISDCEYGDTLLRNIGSNTDYTALYLRT
jgi:hypothetical protein